MDTRAERMLSQVRHTFTDILGDKLTGIYIHGSLAFGCFRWETSDIDFLAVVREPVTQAEKERMGAWILSVEGECPPKGLEMSVVEERYCRDFVYPTPYLFHYSVSHRERCRTDLPRYCREMQGTDPDLAAHFTVTRTVGFPLCGPAVEEVFGPVPAEAYLDSIRQDVENGAEEITENPVYVTLNLCRVLAWLRDGLVLSKADGGRWGMEHLAEKAIIGAALDTYVTGAAFAAEGSILRGFAEVCLAEILE